MGLYGSHGQHMHYSPVKPGQHMHYSPVKPVHMCQCICTHRATNGGAGAIYATSCQECPMCACACACVCVCVCACVNCANAGKRLKIAEI